MQIITKTTKEQRTLLKECYKEMQESDFKCLNPECKDGILMLRKGESEKAEAFKYRYFIGCSEYPNCRYATSPDDV